METTKRTNRDILRFIQFATAWQNKAKAESPLTGFGYAISRVLKSSVKPQEDFSEAQSEINIDCAAASNEKGEILTDSRGQTIFNAEQAKKRNKMTRVLLDTETDIGCYFAKKIPDDLTAAQIDAFEGFVIPEMTEPAGE